MKILYIASGYLPYTFSENLCNAKLVYSLQKKGWEVDVISKTDSGPTYSSEWTEPWLELKGHTHEVSYPIGNKLQRIFDFIYCSIMMEGYPLNGIRWAKRAYEKALLLHQKKHYDAVLTRSPSDIPHIVGYKFAKKTGIRWIANWNDPADTIWPSPYTHHLAPIKHFIIERFTQKCLRKATINTFPSQTLLEHFKAYFPFLEQQKTVVIPHIGMPEDLLSFKVSKKRDKMYMCHSGNLSIERSPELAFKAIRELIDEKEISIQLDIMGHANQYTENLIQQFKLENHVSFVGSYPYLEALKKMQEYDVLVLLEAILEKGIFFASKFTDYAQIGNPILAISPSIGFAQTMLEEQGGGIAVDNSDYKKIKGGIFRLYQSWEKDSLAKEYNTQKLFSLFSSESVVNIYQNLLK